MAAGDALIDPAITRRLIQQFVPAVRPRGDLPPGLATLTPRERDVLRLVAQGLVQLRDRRRAWWWRRATVKTHVARILMKLGLRDRVQVVVYAYEHGLTNSGVWAAAPGQERCNPLG